MLWRVSTRGLFHDGPFEQSQVSSDLATALPVRDLCDKTVEISPIDSVKRHSVGRHGLVVESIYAPVRSRITIHYGGPVHLLVLYEDGGRREGETSIDGLPPSSLRKFANKLTFVPAGHRFLEWHETNRPVRITYLYFNPAKPENSTHVVTPHSPKVFFEDSMLWATAVKLKSALESNNAGPGYLEALVNVLAHEVSRSGEQLTRASQPNRGGLASWQMRTVADYIEEHLNEQIPLAKLAQLARLSQHHFCRAFKNSFGLPPHGYHLRRRVQQAKALLSDRAISITDVGLVLGYHHSSSFTLTFRKITGQTPSEFRRNVK